MLQQWGFYDIQLGYRTSLSAIYILETSNLVALRHFCYTETSRCLQPKFFFLFFFCFFLVISASDAQYSHFLASVANCNHEPSLTEILHQWLKGTKVYLSVTYCNKYCAKLLLCFLVFSKLRGTILYMLVAVLYIPIIRYPATTKLY